MITRNTDGITRTVYLTKKYAIKVACGRYGWRIFLHGLLANLQERNISRVGKHMNRNVGVIPEVCPVLWADPLGLVAIQPRIPILERELTPEEYNKLVIHEDYTVPAENKQGHFGMYQGRLVTVDYGSYGK